VGVGLVEPGRGGLAPAGSNRPTSFPRRSSRSAVSSTWSEPRTSTSSPSAAGRDDRRPTQPAPGLALVRCRLQPRRHRLLPGARGRTDRAGAGADEPAHLPGGARCDECRAAGRPPRPGGHPDRWRGRRVHVQQGRRASSVAAQLGDQALPCLPPPRRPRRLPPARPWALQGRHHARRRRSGAGGLRAALPCPAPPPPSTSTPTPCPAATGPPSTSWPNSSPQPPTELPAHPRIPAAERSSRSRGPGASHAGPGPMRCPVRDFERRRPALGDTPRRYHRAYAWNLRTQLRRWPLLGRASDARARVGEPATGPVVRPSLVHAAEDGSVGVSPPPAEGMLVTRDACGWRKNSRRAR
jgi:hypothetical protein